MNRTVENKPGYISYPVLISLEILGLLLFSIPAITVSFLLKYIDTPLIVILILVYICSIPLFAVVLRIPSAYWKNKTQSITNSSRMYGGICGGLLGIFNALSHINITEKIIILLTALAFGIVTGEIAAGIINRMIAGRNSNMAWPIAGKGAHTKES